MNLENIMPNERNQTQDYILYDSMYVNYPKQVKFTEAENKLVAGGKGEWGVTAK